MSGIICTRCNNTGSDTMSGLPCRWGCSFKRAPEPAPPEPGLIDWKAAHLADAARIRDLEREVESLQCAKSQDERINELEDLVGRLRSAVNVNFRRAQDIIAKLTEKLEALEARVKKLEADRKNPFGPGGIFG